MLLRGSGLLHIGTTTTTTSTTSTGCRSKGEVPVDIDIKEEVEVAVRIDVQIEAIMQRGASNEIVLLPVKLRVVLEVAIGFSAIVPIVTSSSSRRVFMGERLLVLLPYYYYYFYFGKSDATSYSVVDAIAITIIT